MSYGSDLAEGYHQVGHRPGVSPISSRAESLRP